MASAASALVRRVVQDNGPLSAKEIYRAVKTTRASTVPSSSHSGGRELIRLRKPPPSESASDLLIPSFSFLKKHVLPDLKNSPQFELKHVRRPITTPGSSHTSPSESISADSDPALQASTSGAAQVPSVSVWVWRTTSPEDIQRREQQLDGKWKRKTRTDPLKYDAATDRLSLAGAPNIEHLSWRRQRSRLRKEGVEREEVREAQKLRVSKQEAASA